MQKTHTFKQFIIRNSYLLVAAAWLITISFIIDNYWSDNSSVRAAEKNISKYVREQEDDFEQLAGDSASVFKLASGKYNEAFLKNITDKPYFFFVFRQNAMSEYDMAFWSTQVVKPTNAILADADSSGFIQLSNGNYVWRKTPCYAYTTVALIPIKWDYSITNEYLKNNFAVGEDIEDGYAISEGPYNNTVIKSKTGKFLFSLEQKSQPVISHNNLGAVICRLLAAFLILLFIHFVATYLVQKNFSVAVLFLITVVVGIRILSYYYPLPLNFRQFELFDPSVYGSNAVLRSLGDLLINAILLLWLTLFTRHYIEEKKVIIQFKSPILNWFVVLVGVVLILVITFICGNVFRSLVADSQISFDVVNFFTLTYYTVIGFVVLGCISISYFFVTQIIAYLITPQIKTTVFPLSFFVAIVGLIGLSSLISMGSVTFELMLLGWLILYLYLLNNKYLSLLASKIVSSRLVFWLFFFSFSIAAIIIVENKKKEIDRRQHYAETLSTKADPSSERLMNTVLTDFRSEVLAPLFDEFKIDSTNKILKDSLLSENFTGYLNKYDTRIYTFSDTEKPLFNQDSTSFNTLLTILNTQGKPTAIADLYYYDVSYDRFTYISKKDITDTSGKILGYVFILASPKKYKTDALYPELFLKGYNNSIENSPIYSYAVYNKFQLVNSHNDYAFPWQLDQSQVPATEFENIRKGSYDELWYKAATDKIVIIAKQDNFFIESITLFSYLFCSFLFVTAIFWFLNAVIRSRFKLTEMRQYWQMSIRNQVHGTIIFISLLSFLVIGVATILFFIDRYNSNNKEKLSRTIHVMANEVRNTLGELSAFDDVIKIYDQAYKASLEQMVTKISEIHAADINLYDLEGNLQVSSLPLPYSKGIVGTKMDPMAYYHLRNLKEIQYFGEEKIGTLEYLSNYVPVIDESGKEYAYLNIPYFTAQTKLRQEISNFLVAIINLNAFIFLIAGVVALFLTNRITSSFSFISHKMREVNLGKKNEAIIWNRKDEIGELINEYNTMVNKLDDSAIALAKSEREGAWREMAKQVAHEIKNPLTPMKLSLQYLQKAIDSNSGDVKQLGNSVAKTLVEQIDHLSQIASDFSQFANIGNPKNELFDLNETLRSVAQLHAIEDNVELTWHLVSYPVIIDADSTHINRLFNNLVQNALQAIPADRKPVIDIKEVVKEKRVLIIVRDNGLGIPHDMRSKIFMPNFTTKTSGTGLGLAMCKGIVEQSKGKIWFQTEEGVGTTFFVELPLAEEDI
ncbi:sensor histidine kinase [Ferruginibacter sp. SUN002]|uniref:sensor histidine kinase n=1 Tax=Ferruginibacter sp. SUN002 TaxID=2937789 RepID=UPI003D369D09